MVHLEKKQQKNKPILVYEGGESMRFDYNAINEGVNGCLRLMKATIWLILISPKTMR